MMPRQKDPPRSHDSTPKATVFPISWFAGDNRWRVRRENFHKNKRREWRWKQPLNFRSGKLLPCCQTHAPPFSIRCSRFIDGATFVTQELLTVFVIILRHSAVLLLSSDRGSVQRLESERECYEGGASTSDMPLSFNSGLLHQSFKTKHLNFVN